MNRQLTIPPNNTRLETLRAFAVYLEQLPADQELSITVATKKNPRTLTQNRAIHKYFELLADELNGAGFDMRVMLKQSVDIVWTPNSVKNYLWRPIQNAMTDKESTAKLTSREVSEVYEVLSRELSEKKGIYIAFPAR